MSAGVGEKSPDATSWFRLAFPLLKKLSKVRSSKAAMAENEDRSSTTAALPGIQALRALAAMAVVVAHTGGEFEEHLSLPGLMPSFIHGGAGVDLFFVISGFVMVYSSERLFGQHGAPRSFMMRRLIRIVPPYWLLTTVMLLFVMVRGFAVSDASPMLAVSSYFFIPYPRPSGPIDPLYGVGSDSELRNDVLLDLCLLVVRASQYGGGDRITIFVRNDDRSFAKFSTRTVGFLDRADHS